MRPFLTGVLSSLVLIGCGTATKTGSPDAGAADSGLESACGQPGAVGNSLGVGQYCNTANNVSCPSGTLCSDIVNQPTTPQNDTFVCIIPECDPCAPASACGEGAQCVCSASLGGCGCFPTSTCPGIVATFQATTTCMDAGTPDAGPGTDAGPGADAGTGADAGPADAGSEPADAGSADAGPAANCYNACISQNPTSYTAFVDTELKDCGCNSGSPCASVCTAECANMSTYSDSSTCGTCIGNQENLGSGSVCTSTAGAYCLFDTSAACYAFIKCSDGCPM
jgi:hypothetical protein